MHENFIFHVLADLENDKTIYFDYIRIRVSKILEIKNLFRQNQYWEYKIPIFKKDNMYIDIWLNEKETFSYKWKITTKKTLSHFVNQVKNFLP